MDVEVQQRPPIVPMGPLGLGQIIGGAFRLFTITPAVTVGLPAVAALSGAGGIVGLGLVLQATGGWWGPGWPWALAVLAAAFLLAITLMVVAAATSFVVLDHAVRGQPIGAGAALAAGLRRSPGLAGVCLATLLIGVLIMAIGIAPFFLPAVIGSTDDSALFFGLLLTLIVIGASGYSAYVQVSLFTAGPSYVVEGIGVGAALSAAREQSHGNWWRTYAALFVSCVLMQILGSVLWIVGGMPILLLARDASAAATMAAESLMVLVAVAAASFFTAVIGLLYYDQRARSRLRI